MILIIETSAEKHTLHFFEFVKPLIDIAESTKETVDVMHWSEVDEERAAVASRIILCGNGLLDNKSLSCLKSFSWLEKTNVPVLGICAGAQIISRFFGGRIFPSTRIGVNRITFLHPDPLLSAMSKYNVYELHTKRCTVPPGFVELAETDIPMAFRKADAPVYGVLWHPEVMNKEMVRAFCTMNWPVFESPKELSLVDVKAPPRKSVRPRLRRS